MCIKGIISNISHGSFHDGTGIRTVVYFKGCGLRCVWCHNPETLSMTPEILYYSDKCIGCGECIKICPSKHKAGTDKMEFLRRGCMRCGKCAEVCPSGALSVNGKEMTAEEIFAEIKKDSHYYLQSGGGVTLSGGECLLQAEFTAEILKMCKENEIHTAIESSFFVPYKNVEKILPYVDLIFVDFKHYDSEKHKQYTGHNNTLIIENIRRVSGMHNNIIIRIPLIPGVNDSIEDMEAFGAVIKTFGKGVKGVELLKYNYLAESKYNSIGMKYTSFGKQTQSDEQVKKLQNVLDKYIQEDTGKGRNC